MFPDTKLIKQYEADGILSEEQDDYWIAKFKAEPEYNPESTYIIEHEFEFGIIAIIEIQ